MPWLPARVPSCDNAPRIMPHHHTTKQQLAEAIDRAAADEGVTCLVLTGKGDYFSSGADLTDDSWSPGA